MSVHQFFKRMAVDPQQAQQARTVTLPAPTRGLIMNENASFVQPGGAQVLDNWKPTMTGCALRGGFVVWSQLPETTPVISMFQYISANVQRMFAGNATKLYEVTAGGAPTLVKSGQTSGNYCASQMANQGGDYMLAVNDNGDPVLRFNGVTWTTLSYTTPANWGNNTVYALGARATDTADSSHWKVAVAHTSATSGTFLADRTAHPTYWVQDGAPDGSSWITGPPGTTVVNGNNLVYVWKYRNRWFFIEGGTMNAYYLPTYAIGGQLQQIPLSGSTTKGGRLLAGFSWSIDAGDGIDDKCVFMTDQGELLIFTGSDPSTASNWRQEGRYTTAMPLGMNAWTQVGGDVLIATTEGIIPISASITKDIAQLDLAAITRPIKPLWRNEVNLKRGLPWTMCKWDEYGGLFVTWPGGQVGNQYCGIVNVATGAWARFTGWDVMCFGRMRENMFFGTQAGTIMQAERTGTDNGKPYVATLVGGWEMFSSQSTTMVWRQARASFQARSGESFIPQISATVDYTLVIPPPPPAGPDPGPLDVWDEGTWASTPPAAEPTFQAKWDLATVPAPTVYNTGWVSVGATGFSHAPIVQVTVAQVAVPEVELISIAATYEPCGVNI